MFLGTVTDYTSVANAVIPFTTVINSNDKVTNNNGTLSINKSGYYDIDASLSLSSTAGATVTVSVYADGVARTISQQTVVIGANGQVNVAIVDAVKVVLAQLPNVANIYIAVNQANVVVDGTIRVEYVR